MFNVGDLVELRAGIRGRVVHPPGSVGIFPELVRNNSNYMFIELERKFWNLGHHGTGGLVIPHPNSHGYWATAPGVKIVERAAPLTPFEADLQNYLDKELRHG